MLSLPVEPIHVQLATLALLVATVAAAQRYRLGPHADWIEVVRSLLLPVLDAVVERAVGDVGAAVEISDDDLVGVLEGSPERVAAMLWAAGCRRNLMATHKTPVDGRGECGSWAYRGPAVDARMQVHVQLFEAPDGGTAVAAHWEYSSAAAWLWRNRSVLVGHYRTVYDSPAVGARFVREEILPDVTWT